MKRKYILTRKERAKISKRHIINRLTRKELVDGLLIHKMYKWERRNPKPTEIELKQDLFPDELILGWEAGREIAMKFILNKLEEKYLNIAQHKIKYVHDVAIYINEHTGKKYNYPNVDSSMTLYIPNTTNKSTLTQALIAKKIAIKRGGNKIVKLNLYDNRGKLRIAVQII